MSLWYMDFLYIRINDIKSVVRTNIVESLRTNV